MTSIASWDRNAYSSKGRAVEMMNAELRSRVHARNERAYLTGN